MDGRDTQIQDAEEMAGILLEGEKAIDEARAYDENKLRATIELVCKRNWLRNLKKARAMNEHHLQETYKRLDDLKHASLDYEEKVSITRRQITNLRMDIAQ